MGARSKVFDAMFSAKSGYAESDGVVVIKEAEPDVLQAFVRFLYTDEIDTSEKDKSLADLLVLANRYDVQALKEHCTQKLANSLTIDNAATLLGISSESEAPVLRQRVLDFISGNVDDVM